MTEDFLIFGSDQDIMEVEENTHCTKSKYAEIVPDEIMTSKVDPYGFL